MNFTEAINLLTRSRKILLTTHTRPDGDACGCIRALGDALEARGKEVRALVMSPLASWYSHGRVFRWPVVCRTSGK